MGSKVGEYVSRTRIGAHFHEARESRKLVLVIVAIALLLDNMLLTTVVPIIPGFLYEIRHRHQTTIQPTTTREPTTTPYIEYSTLDPDWLEHNTSYPGSIGEHDENMTLIKHHYTTTTTLSPEQLKHNELIEENVETGFMFASKAVVQLITNPFVGPLTHRIGYSIPMFCGFIIMFISTVIFAFGRSYSVLFIARALQGVGSSCSSVSGMGMLAERYPDDKERGNAMGIALGGLAMGVLIGPPFGGFMYEFFGKTAPFLILACLALADGCLQLLVLQPAVNKLEEDDAPSLKTLITDPYILCAAGAITFANTGIAMLEPSLPIHMMDIMQSEKLTQGLAFLPASISYAVGTNLFGPLGHRMGRWKASMIGLAVIGFSLMLVPLATTFHQLIIPMAALGFAIGMVDSSMMPELGNLVDHRHAAVYGGVYAIGDVAFCLGFAVGPSLSGVLVKTIGFRKMLNGIGFICLIYCPLLIYLKDPPGKTIEEKNDENSHLVFGEKTKVKYANFDDQLMDEEKIYMDK